MASSRPSSFAELSGRTTPGVVVSAGDGGGESGPRSRTQSSRSCRDCLRGRRIFGDGSRYGETVRADPRDAFGAKLDAAAVLGVGAENADCKSRLAAWRNKIAVISSFYCRESVRARFRLLSPPANERDKLRACLLFAPLTRTVIFQRGRDNYNVAIRAI